MSEMFYIWDLCALSFGVGWLGEVNVHEELRSSCLLKDITPCFFADQKVFDPQIFIAKSDLELLKRPNHLDISPSLTGSMQLL